jgi:hypothetical protein
MGAAKNDRDRAQHTVSRGSDRVIAVIATGACIGIAVIALALSLLL